MYYKEKADVVWIYTYEGEKEAVDKERIMKILAGIITIAGIVVLAFLILDNKAEQRKVQQVAAEDEKKTQSLEYIEMEELENHLIIVSALVLCTLLNYITWLMINYMLELLVHIP